MRKISITLFAALVLSSCQHKEARTNLVTEKKEASTSIDTRQTENKDEISKVNLTTLASESPSPQAFTVSRASAGTVSDAYAEKDNQESKPPILNIQNRTESKEPSQIIKNATVSFQVSNTDSSHERITQMLSGSQAYFGSDKRVQNSYEIQQTMVIRVPAANFDKLMDELMKESVYTYNKDITADDVTAEFVDIQARLKSKKEVEKRYTELLSRAQKVTDVLEVENNLRVIREEIESTEGRLKLLKDEVSYSTITLTTLQKLKGDPQPEISFAYRLKEASVNGWRGLEFLALTIVTLWPFLLIISPFVVWIVVRRKRT